MIPDFMFYFGLCYWIFGAWFLVFSILDVRSKTGLSLRDSVMVFLPVAWIVVIWSWPLYVRSALSEWTER